MQEKRKIISKVKKFLYERPETIYAYLHGSFLEGIFYRDIDIAIYIDYKKMTWDNKFDYCEQINIELSKLTRIDIDIQILNDTPLGFYHSVIKNGKLLFSKNDELRVDNNEKKCHEYIDFYEYSLQYLMEIA